MASVKRERDPGVQTAIRLASKMHERLKVSGRNVSEEIRRRLEESFEREDAADDQTRALSEAIEQFATLVRLQTGHDWHSHPAANRVLRHMITGRLARLKPEGEPVFAADELPKARLVAPESDDVEAMGLALEAMQFHTPPLTPERREALDKMRAESLDKMRKQHFGTDQEKKR